MAVLAVKFCESSDYFVSLFQVWDEGQFAASTAKNYVLWIYLIRATAQYLSKE